MRALMLQGTASGVGKSVLVAGLCRLLARNGVRVAPFKPQNMSNNAAVTVDGGEIGRAQALQALACGIEPTVDMNPVLIKPEADERAQLIVRGQVAGRLDARRFREDRAALLETVLASFERLRSCFDVVLVEGAGSPAEPNLRRGDIANMGFAEAADVPVWLVGDINRGGVFAALKGTLDILSERERARVQALLINGFRGSRALLADALHWLEAETGKPVAGVVPWLELDLPEEDAPYRHARAVRPGVFHVAVVAWPRMSNHDDLDPLSSEPGVAVRFVRRAEALQPADVVILPGSKHVPSDLAWFRARGFAQALLRHVRYGGYVLGICGGMQVLGRAIHAAVEGGKDVPGLGLLALDTVMRRDKVLKRVDALAAWPARVPVSGYEIHHGESSLDATLFPFAARSADGRVWGTYVHGLFSRGAFRRAWLAAMGWRAGSAEDHETRMLASLDRLADALRGEVAPDLLEPLLGTKCAA
ncbi:MAG: cobyric acid synthase [Zetaproteobacteria bacterium]|nr:MAG: cobyric acid synthase [Zetaproteobacteria bacterium]